MKVTLNTDGSVTFDVATAAEATALARELQGGAATNGHAVQSVVETAVCTNEEAVTFVTEDPDVDEDVESAASAVAHDNAVGKRASESDIKKAAANAAGLSLQHYVVWEYLVDKDSQRGGVSVDQVMKKFHISRGAATQRLATLAKQGYATRVGRGHYRAATP